METEGEVLVSYFGCGEYGPVGGRLGRAVGLGVGRRRGQGRCMMEEVPMMSPETDESPAISPLVLETPGRR